MTYWQIGGIAIVLGIPALLLAVDAINKYADRWLDRKYREWLRYQRPRQDERDQMARWKRINTR